MEPQSLSTAHEAYDTAFQAYEAKSTVREVRRTYTLDAAGHVMKKIAHHARKAEVFHVLSVGSGDGENDIEILKIVARSLRSSLGEDHKPRIQACNVEPSSIIEDFKRSVSPLPDELANLADVSFEWQQKTLEDFHSISEQSKERRYHLIHFICSLYYMDADDSLKKCFRQLASGGALFCSVAGEESYFAKLAKQGNQKWQPIPSFYSGKDIVAIAERNNWSYEELPTVKYAADITSLFDKSSQTGSLLLDFMTHKTNFRETADKELYDEMMDFITANTITDEKGRKIVTPELAIVIIYK